MRIRGHGNRIDENHKAIVKGLRQAGCRVVSLASVGNGCPDLLWGRAGRFGLLEVKGAKARLSEPEEAFAALWGDAVQTVRSLDEALIAVGLLPPAIDERDGEVPGA